ncbi:DEAD/DEAH box helicase [Deinococcus marmoris]|uniref:DEAD/DEAH box helicase n=1 Tax=Deinococcus marmoris TaxID=249408 RepID=UPI00068AF396|nr:DEAD/DEAH box helicase [Deinococcus marmoris]
MAFDIGSMVTARGRDWVVQPESDDDFLLLKPLGGSDAETTGIFTGQDGEDVRPASFAPPGATAFSDAGGARLLLNAARLAIRSGAGPFRSLGRMGVQPRPYQLVPLLMALRQSPARLLIADDVGIGKTVEAALIARELLDRGEISRLAVLCPPHLAGQWVEELRSKFGIDAVAVLPSTARRLERGCDIGQSLFERYKHVVVSLDLVKSDRWRQDFLSHAPEFIIVDEAHASAEGEGHTGSKRHQRYRLLEDLARDPERHLILVTATPHSGKEDAFRSLLKLLNPDFATLPLAPGSESARARETLARHLVQRRRADIGAYLQEDTPFPARQDAELQYTLHPEYSGLFDDVLAYARESVHVPGEALSRQRIRWWAALGLLRALASSPQAAAETLRARALGADLSEGESQPALINSLGREVVLDPGEDEREALDVTPGAQIDGPDSETSRRLEALAVRADGLSGAKDRKLTLLTEQVKQLLAAGFAPIVFCRFIATAEAVAAHLNATFKDIAAEAVTGRLTPDERADAVARLGGAERRVLVATDCLSEGINLQDNFSAVIHYDLPWNPTRLDQREGRVDRYGQVAPEVKVLTIYGADNQIDTLILEVLVRKHRTIRATLGTSIPAPDEAESLLDQLLSRVLDTPRGQSFQPLLFEDVQSFDAKWRDAAEGEKRSRSRFAQNAIRTEEVALELRAVREALGGVDETRHFMLDALKGARVTVTPRPDGSYVTDPAQAEVSPEMRDVLRRARTFRFDAQVERGVVNLARNHPVIEQLASTLLGQALDDEQSAIAKRAGVIRTAGVQTVTTLLLLRHRFLLQGRKGNNKWQTLAEELDPVAYRGRAENNDWLTPEEVRALLELTPVGNLSSVQKEDRLTRALDDLETLRPTLDARAQERAAALLDAHERVRGAARGLGATYTIEPPGPPDPLGIYVFVPLPPTSPPSSNPQDGA